VSRKPPTPERRIVEARAAVLEAQRDLADALRAACPGPHRYRQRGDALPPWCAACSRTPNGVHVSSLPVATRVRR
jgi:hypothetical protein